MLFKFVSAVIIIILGAVIRKPADLQDLAPGTNPPFVTFNGEVKVDVNKIEEFLEEKLTPPRYTNAQTPLIDGYKFADTLWNSRYSHVSLIISYPRLAPKHPESNTAGIDVFAKFSAYIKNPRKDTNDGKTERGRASMRESWIEI